MFDGVLRLIRSGNDLRTQGHNDALYAVRDLLLKQEPFAWHWYDAVNERYEFTLRRKNAPADAQPLYRSLER